MWARSGYGQRPLLLSQSLCPRSIRALRTSVSSPHLVSARPEFDKELFLLVVPCATNSPNRLRGRRGFHAGMSIVRAIVIPRSALSTSSTPFCEGEWCLLQLHPFVHDTNLLGPCSGTRYPYPHVLCWGSCLELRGMLCNSLCSG